MNKKNIYLLVIAGGPGTRLWPFSTSDRPKFLLDIEEGKTIIEKNIEAYESFINKENVYISTTKGFIQSIKKYVKRINEWNIVEEPVSKGSLSGAILSTQRIYEHDPDAKIIYTCSDILFKDVDSLRKSIKNALHETEKQRFVMLGIEPEDKGLQDYGYIKAKVNKKNTAYNVDKFIEKPTETEFTQFFLKDGFYQAGVLIYSAAFFFDLMKRHVPSVWKQVKSFREDEKKGIKVGRAYDNIKAMNVNYDFIENLPSEMLSVICVDSRWYKIRNIETYYELLDKDENHVVGKVMNFKSKHCIVRRKTKKPVYLYNIEDIIFVENDGYIIIGKLDNSTCELRDQVPNP
ncbi:hypothetical protein JW887_00845 [Candidatus Dojkabacteria bacterium]|nr:hypothetical protein [Candidatus Dojkabacteria bacterium]